MKSVAAILGKEVLRDVDEKAFYERLPEIRKTCGDRAVLRAIHFFEENKRVRLQIWALKNDNFDAFLSYVTSPADPRGCCCRTSFRQEIRRIRTSPLPLRWLRISIVSR